MEFGDALASLREGKKLARTGWNGKDQYIQLQTRDENSKMTQPYLYIVASPTVTVPWVGSQTDLLNDDWFVVE
jgi:hypothetical protein